MRPDTLLRYAFALAFVLAGTGWLTTANAQQRTTTTEKEQAKAIDPIGRIEAPGEMLSADGFYNSPTAPAYTRSGLLVEGFEDGVPPTGWEVVDVLGTGTWDTNLSNIRALNSDSSAFFNDFSGDQDDWLISQPYDLSGFGTPTLYYYENVNFTSFAADQLVKVSTDYDGGGDPSTATWTTINSEIGPEDTFQRVELDLSAFAGESSVYIAFHYVGNFAAEWYIDHVFVAEPLLAQVAPGCPVNVMPDGGTVDNDPTNGVLLTWEPTTFDPTDPAYPTGYSLDFGVQDPPTDIEDFNAQGGNAIFTGAINPGTTFFYQVTPLNAAGPAADCPIYSFTTEEAPVSNFPAETEMFAEGFMPQNWFVFEAGSGVNDVMWEVLNRDELGGFVAASTWENVDAGSAIDYLVTPAFTVGADGSTLTFGLGQDFGSDFGSTVEVRVTTGDPTDASGYTTVATYTEVDIPVDALGDFEVDLSSFDGQMVHAAIVHINDDGDRIFVDNIGLMGGGGEQVSLPITFEDDNVDYELVDFGGASSMLVEDPEDPTNTAVETVRPDAAECFAGTTVANATGFDMPIPFAEGETKMTVRVWSPAAGVRVRFKVEKFDDPTISVEADEFTTVAGAWETLEYDFIEDQVPNTAPLNFDAEYTKASIFFNFQCDVAGTPTATDTYYWDDIAFGGADMGAVTIAEAREAGAGATVTVEGTVTRAMGAFTYIQDETAGLTIRQTSGAFFDDVADGTITEGTMVEVTGTLSEFANLLQINEGDLASYAVLGNEAPPAPQVVTLQTLVDSGEEYEAELVQVVDLTTDAMGTFAAGTSYTVTDPTASDTLRVPNAGDSDIDGTMIPGGEFTFTGVVGQFSFDGPGLGYQLLAIEEGDVEPEGVAGLLDFDPSPLVEMLLAGETGTETVTITNTSDSEVTFDFVQYSGENLEKAPPTSDEPSLELAKGEDDPRGYAQSFGAGGPDAFGYEWIDSNEPGGPAFEAINISETGTELTEADFDPEECTFDPLDEGNALVELPFDFSFYGETYSSVKVNINGHLNFNADGAPLPCAFTNDPMPDTGTPNGGLIAPLWDDYDASPEGADGGQIFYETLADGRFVIQYDNVQKFADDAENNTFQVILSPSGAIKYQYVDLNETTFSYSIGIENPDGTIGLEVAMGSDYAEEGLAVLIQARPSFVTDVTPATGTIPAGGTAEVEVSFSAEGLIGGTYEGVLNVDTDLDADPSMFELPVVLEVTGVAACMISPDPVEFEDTIVGFSSSEEVTVSNGGTDACELTGASADGPFSVEGFEATTLDPGASATFTVVYTPTAAGDASGTLTVETDGDDLTAALEGTGLEPPSFSVDPASLTFEVVSGTVSDAQTLTLSNTGDGAGAFSVSVANATRRGLTPTLGEIEPIVTLNAPETASLLAQMAGKSIVNARSGVTLTAKPGTNEFRGSQVSLVRKGNADVLRGGGNPGDLIASTPTVASISGFGQTPDGTLYVCDLNAGAATETFTFDGSSFTSTGTFAQPGAAGTNITGCTYYPEGNDGAGSIWYLNANLATTPVTASFIETDLSGTPTGAVVPLALPAGTEVPIGLSYSEATGWFFLVDISGDDILAFNPDGSLVDGYPVPQTCLDDGTGSFGNALDALGGGLDVLVGTSTDARPTRVQVTEFDGSCRGDGEGNDLFTPITVTTDAFINGVLRDREAPNEVMYLGANSDLTVYAIVPVEREDIGSFLAIDPEEGIVEAGGDQEISVVADATNLDPGTYTADIVIATNDPANPVITVPVTVEVTPVPPANEGDGVPTEFALGQNYPNPFASRTTIDYALPEAARVTITVYDAVGRRVAVLVDEDLTPGYHSAEWDTRGLASGVYLYRIEAGSYAKTRKLSIVR